MKVSDIQKVLDLSKLCGFTPCFVGKRGIGKTQGHEQWAKKNGYELITFRLGQIDDPGEISGIPYVVSGEHVSKVVEYIRLKFFDLDPNKNYLIHLDEINRTKPQILNAVFQLLENPAGLNGFKFGENVFVSSSANPWNDAYNTLDLSQDEALADRLAFCAVEADLSTFLSYTRSKKSIDPGYAELLTQKPNYFTGDKDDSVGIDLSFVKPSPRSHETAQRVIRLTNYNPELYSLVLPGIIGEGLTAELIAANSGLRSSKIDTTELLTDYAKVKPLINFEDPSAYGNVLDGVFDAFKTDLVAFDDKVLGNIYSLLTDLNLDASTSFLRKLFLQGFVASDAGFVEEDKRKVRVMGRMMELSKRFQKEFNIVGK